MWIFICQGFRCCLGMVEGSGGGVRTRFQAQMRDAFRRVIDLRYLGSEERTGKLIY
jgi:hypothetical protein